MLLLVHDLPSSAKLENPRSGEEEVIDHKELGALHHDIAQRGMKGEAYKYGDIEDS